MHEHPTGHPIEMDDDAVAAARRELIASVDRFIATHYGERCSTVQGGCPTCSVWAARDVLNATIFE